MNCLIGKKFNRLIILEYIPGKRIDGKKFSARVICLCECGNKKNMPKHQVIHGISKSCGCYNLEKIKQRNFKHGHNVRNHRTPEYRSWHHMKERCLNPMNKNFDRYGGRGISICVEWLKFENFIKDMGLKPFKKASIDRINNDGNYTKENCRWTDQKTQVNNSTVVSKAIIRKCQMCEVKLRITPCHLGSKKYCSRKCQANGFKGKKKKTDKL